MDKVKQVQLSEIAELITKGTTPTTLGYEFVSNGVNFLKIECFDENGAFLEDKVAHISEECHEKLKRSQLKAGDILFSIAGAIGRVAVVTDEMIPANTNQALAIIRISNDKIYLPYVKLILTSPIVWRQFENKKQGVAQLNLSLKDINELVIPLPDLSEQIKCADLFGKVSRIIENRKAELNKCDDLIKARFVELFGDDIAHTDLTIGDISEEATVGIANSATHAYAESGVVMLRNQNIRVNYLDDSDLIYIRPEFASKYENKKLRANDILVTRTGVNVGMACLVPEKYAGCQTFTTLILRLKNNIRITLTFGCHNINSPLGKGFIDEKKVGGAQPNFGVKQLVTMPIAIPSEDKQRIFDVLVKQVDKSKSVVQKSLDEAQLLFDSLMQNYFG